MLQFGQDLYHTVSCRMQPQRVISPNCRSLGNPSLIPGLPLQSHSIPCFLSQPSYATLTNTPIGAFHLQPCQTYEGSSPLLGVPISECHQLRQTSCQRDGFKKHRIQTNTVKPRLTNFSVNEDFFQLFFWTRLKNMDSANECFGGCTR